MMNFIRKIKDIFRRERVLEIMKHIDLVHSSEIVRDEHFQDAFVYGKYKIEEISNSKIKLLEYAIRYSKKILYSFAFSNIINGKIIDGYGYTYFFKFNKITGIYYFYIVGTDKVYYINSNRMDKTNMLSDIIKFFINMIKD